MAVRGDFQALRSLRERLQGAARAGFRRELSNVLGTAAMKLSADGFRASADPYGEAWAPLRRRKGKPLLDTGRLRAAFSAQHVEGTEAGFKLSVPVSYARVHQFGAKAAPHTRIGRQVIWQNPATGRIISRRVRAGGKFPLKMVIESVSTHRTFSKGITIPARPMFPDRARGLPQKWLVTFDRDAGNFLRRKLGKGAR